jgi:hypothetical protein
MNSSEADAGAEMLHNTQITNNAPIIRARTPTQTPHVVLGKGYVLRMDPCRVIPRHAPRTQK